MVNAIDEAIKRFKKDELLVRSVHQEILKVVMMIEKETGYK